MFIQSCEFYCPFGFANFFTTIIKFRIFMYNFFIFTLGVVCAVCTSELVVDQLSTVSPDEDEHTE